MLQQADKMGCREFVTAQVFFYQNKINRHYLVKISNIYVNVNVTLITDTGESGVHADDVPIGGSIHLTNSPM